MIPLNITLKGIYSYREEQTIDFTHLTEASIFGIFGSVGCGKSTILEAISFALYGITERLNLRGDGLNYNMMNLKSNELLIDFIFITGEKNQKYRFIVQGKRNKKDFKDVKAYDRTAYKLIKDNWEPIDPNSAEAIIGLSYQNFKRTVIIPQNQFQEFLQLGDKDRTQMMKELFNLDKFELSGKVSVLERENNEKRIEIQGRLSEIGEISQEEIDLKGKQLEELNKAIDNDSKIFKEKSKTELEYRTLKELFQKIIAQKKAISDLEEKEPNIKKLEEQLKEYENCQNNFKNLFDNRKQLYSQIQLQKIEVEAQKQSLTEIKEQLLKKGKEFDKVNIDYNNREQLKRKSEELERIIRVTQLEFDKEECETKIKVAEKYIKDLTDKITKQTTLQKSQKNEISKLKKESPDYAILSEVKDWFTVKNNFQKNINAFRKDKINTESDIKSSSNALQKIISPAINKLSITLPKDSSTDTILDLFKLSKTSLRKQIQGVDTTLQHLAAKNQLKEYANALKRGEPCPLCGSAAHPEILNISDVKNAINKAEKEKDSCQKKVDLIDETVESLKTVSKELETYKRSIGQTEKKLRIEESTLVKHLKKFRWKKFDKDDAARLKSAFEEAEKNKKQIKTTEDALEKTESDIEKDNLQKEKANTKLKAIRETLSGTTASISELKGQLKILDYKQYSNKTEDKIKEEISLLNKQYEEIGKIFTQLEKLLKDLRAMESQLKGNLLGGEKRLTSDQSSMKELEEKIQRKLRESGYNSVEIVESILKLNLNIDTERKKITSFRQDLHTARELYKKLSEQAEGKSYNEEAHIKIKHEIQEINTKLDKLKEERGSLTTQIKQLKENLTARLELQKKLEEINLRGDDIGTLKQLFKASGFVNYVSSVYLYNLCNAANERFYKLTQQKLRLEITDTNNFQVRDFMNDGQVRNVKTLSGGQTFQASLSLALALADSIQKLTKSNQNFFFLDEGFGSLDKQSLYIVFDTLKTLRNENRIVGVISHLEDMQQEIDTYLKIANDEVNGSSITTSWSA